MIKQYLASTTAKAVIGVIILLIVIVSIKSCQGSRQKAAQGQQDTRTATATQETAIDAAQTVIERSDKDATLDQLVTETQKEIANATDSKISRTAAANAICGMFDGDSKPTGC
jgi:uncharacterized alpha/beta hydrolase family protein